MCSPSTSSAKELNSATVRDLGNQFGVLELLEGAGHALAHPADHPPPELALVRLFETETEARR
jgi:hypothetical protein